MSEDRETGIDRPADLEADFGSLADDVRASGRVPDFRSMMERVHAEVADNSSMSDDVTASDTAADTEVISIGSRSTDSTPGARTSDARTSEDARRDFRRLGRWIPVAAAAAVAGLLLFSGGTGGDDEFERLVADYSASAGDWRSPTASLMDIPGVDLGSVPSFGGGLLDIDLPDTNSDEGRDS
ncbi:MAG: hypothetical protein HKN72_12320 [Gemmatimonadetes bacterium]|nr:hypothetical protein [Gemmatimonadota bacterium]NNF14007.1 hypothetical protein [Gemmatimonadota bacterium]NNL29918.1 hypothetical protein [Gemmatimonadota bacterium]